MPLHLHREIEKLKQKLLGLSAVVEENVYNAVHAVDKRDLKQARKALETSPEIYHLEIDIEEECLKILALYHPVATDLRFIISLIKINADLERIGDLSCNIAERAEYLSGQEKITIPFKFQEMVEITLWMLHKSIDALIQQDTELARNVCRRDDEVDEINRQMYNSVKEGMRSLPQHLDQMVHLLCISRHLERIADHAVNIAEDVIYMIEGSIVRHKSQTCCQAQDMVNSNK